MPFSSYQSLGDVARAHRITCTKTNFVVPLPLPTMSEALRAELDFALRRLAPKRSEFAVCESLIFPILREVWKHYLDVLMLWSHEDLIYDADLSGTPDYFFARLSPLGNEVMEEPYLLVVEAKRDDFVRGWGQCLAALLAAQKLNRQHEMVIFGIVTNGRIWEFGKLEGALFTEDLRSFTLADLDALCSALRYLFEQCKQQLAGLPALA